MITGLVAAYALMFALPGLAFLSWSRPARPRGGAQVLLETAGVSLSTTILAGYLFNLIGIMHPATYWALIASFAGVLALGLRRRAGDGGRGRPRLSAAPTPARVLHSGVLALGVLALAPPFLEQSGRIISNWDAIFAYNRFALDFAADGVSPTAGHYPQGLPALAAALYLLTGAPEVTLWARQITNAFPLMALLALAVTFRPKSAWVFAAAAAAFLFMLGRVDRIAEGYAYSFTGDMFVWTAVAAAMAAIRAYLLNEDFAPAFDPAAEPRAERLTAAVAIGLFVGLAANAKQLGVFMLPAGPLAALYLTRGAWRARLAFAVEVGVACGLAGAGWYLFVVVNILFLGGETNTGHLVDVVHQGRGLYERAKVAVGNTVALTSWPLLIAMTAGSLLALGTRYGRLMLVVVLAPMTLVHLFVSGYAARNVTALLPVLTVLSGLGLKVLVDAALRLTPALRARLDRFASTPLGRTPGVVPPLGALALTVAAGLVGGALGGDALWGERARAWAAAEESRQSASLGWVSMNRAMEAAMAGEPEGAPVFTNYRVADRLPQLAAYEVIVGGYSAAEVSQLARERDGLNIYVLWYDRAAPAFQAYLDCLEREGLFEMVDHRDDSTKWKFMRRSDAPWTEACEG